MCRAVWINEYQNFLGLDTTEKTLEIWDQPNWTERNNVSKNEESGQFVEDHNVFIKSLLIGLNSFTKMFIW